MSLEKVRDLLAMGVRDNAAVIAFDCCDYNTIAGAIKGAERANKPVMLMLYPNMRTLIEFKVFTETAKYFAKKASVPVGLHLDHCGDFNIIMEAIKDGFTSVMADGSSLPLEQNIAFTKSIVQVAHNFGVDVEGEVGHVGNADSSCEYTNKDFFTTPEELKRFVKETGIDSVAVAFGSAHGNYKIEPKLDFDRLRELNEATEVPLVLHGGSGIPEEQLAKAFCSGINKLNVGTEYFFLNMSSAKEFYSQDLSKVDPFSTSETIQKPLIEYVANKLKLSKINI